jgi:hypothetical protein
MASGRLPITRAVAMAYRDSVRVMHTMPGLALIVGAILFSLNIADPLASSYVRGGMPVASFLKEVGLRVAESILLTPFMIAVHRFIILDEVTGRYAIEWRSPRFERYFVWYLMMWLFTMAAGVVVSTLTDGLSMATAATVALVAFIVVAVVYLRLIRRDTFSNCFSFSCSQSCRCWRS